jgi:CheY-like chemotaxis protein
MSVESTDENPLVYPGGSETILLVEDEARIRRIASLYLMDLGYRVLEAGDAQAAVKMLQDIGGQVDLLLSDIVMPGRMNGRDLASWTREHLPEVQILLTSGQDLSPPRAAGEIPRFIDPLLKKPFTKQQLAQMVRSTLDRCPSQPGVSSLHAVPPSK